MSTDKWPTFCAEYRHPDGHAYIFHFPAKDHDDARIRLRSIQGNGELLGELKGSIPAIPGAGLWVRARCWFGNLFE